MPNSPTRAVPVSGLNGLQMTSSFLPTSSDKAAGLAAAEELIDAGDVFEPEEVFQIQEVLDNYAALTAPSIQESSSLQSTANTDMTRTATIAGVDSNSRNEPYILRSTFCRFLLASKMCGCEDPAHAYHETIIFFDKYSTPLGAFAGMPRGRVVEVITTMLFAKYVAPDSSMRTSWVGSDSMKSAQSLEHINSHKDKEEGYRPPFVRRFLSETLAAASSHSSARRKWLEIAAKQMPEIVPEEVPAAILEEVGDQSKLWPPLPPRFITEKELPDWMRGMRRWQEECEARSPAQILALRAHTENVLHGEILTNQLLEPEVLHFATRFRPLFEKLFASYADFPTPDVLRESGEQTQGGPSPSKDQPIGHMSFSAFFRFCVDFGLFPRHAAFQEIKTIYNDAECVTSIPKPQPDEDSSQEAALGSPESGGASLPVHGSHEDTHQGAAAGSPRDSQAQTTPRRGQRVSAASNQRASPAAAAPHPQHPLHPQHPPHPTHPPHPKSTSPDPHAKDPKAEEPKAAKVNLAIQAKIRKAALAAHAAATAAAAAAEAAVPKADLERFDKSLEEMSTFEVEMLAFFAAVQEWLSEQCIRFADLFGEDAQTILKITPAMESRRASFEHHGGDESHKHGSKRPSIMASAHEDGVGTQQRRHSQGSNNLVAMAIAAATSEAQAAVAPRITMVNAAQLLKAIEPMAMVCRPSEEEVEDMIKAVLDNKDQVEDDVEFKAYARRRSDSTFSEDDSMTFDASSVEHHVPAIAVFQLDKVMKKAQKRFEELRLEASVLFRNSVAPSTDHACCKVLEAMNEHMLQNAVQGYEDEDIWDGREEVTAQFFLEKAESYGMDPETLPHWRDLAELFVSSGGTNAGVLDKHKAYRMLALTDEVRRLRRRAERQTQLNYLAGEGHAAPEKSVFGLAAFVECLLKLSLHRLGGKGANEIQRGAPSWWKCAWLLTRIGGEFKDCCSVQHHEHHVKGLAIMRALGQRCTMAAMPVRNAAAMKSAANRGSVPMRGVVLPTYTSAYNVEQYKKQVDGLETWWRRIFTANVPKYVPPLEDLAVKEPHLFDPGHAESPIPADVRGKQLWAPCAQCKERRSPSGWGSPGCVACGGIDALCLPIDDHLFSPLLKAEPPPPENPVAPEETFETEEADEFDSGDDMYSY